MALDPPMPDVPPARGSVGDQTLIDEALPRHVDNKAPSIQDALLRILREEPRAAG